MVEEAKDGSQKKDHKDESIDFFESSIESLFGQHQAATGEAGQLCTLHLKGYGQDEEEVIQYRIPASKTNKLFAHYQWDAGLFLGHLIHRNSQSIDQEEGVFDIIDDQQHSRVSAIVRPEADVRQTTVLELGAGTGIPGLISAKYGASSVFITDYPDEGILAALQENVQFSSVQKNAKVAGLDWSDEEGKKMLMQQKPEGFERILCADVLWLSSSHLPLLNTIRSMLAKTSTSKCIIVSGFHTGRRAISSFFAMACARHDSQSMHLIPSKDVHGNPIVFEFNVVTNQARQWTGKRSFLSTEDQDFDMKEEQDNMDDFTERTKWLLYVCLEWDK